jgi:hypothetical protein
MKRTILGLAAVAAIATTAGCSEFNDDRGKGDAPVDQQADREVTVWPNGDGFPNVAAFCIGDNGVYSVTGGNRDPLDVVANDPNCAEGGVLAAETGS